MNCLNEQTIWEYIDKELDEPAQRKVEQHLKNCPCCQEQLYEIEALNFNFTKAIKTKDCFFRKPLSSKVQPCEGFVRYHRLYQKRKFFWSVFTLLSIFSMFSALAFIAIVAPDISALPFSGKFYVLKSILIKFAEFFFHSTAILGLLFLGLFVYNFIASKIYN